MKFILSLVVLLGLTAGANAVPCFAVNWAVSKYGATFVWKKALEHGYSKAQIDEAKKCVKIAPKVQPKVKAPKVKSVG